MKLYAMPTIKEHSSLIFHKLLILPTTTDPKERDCAIQLSIQFNVRFTYPSRETLTFANKFVTMRAEINPVAGSSKPVWPAWLSPVRAAGLSRILAQQLYHCTYTTAGCITKAKQLNCLNGFPVVRVGTTHCYLFG